MTIFWTTSSLNYYMILFFLKYIPGSIFVNSSLSCMADIIAYVLSGFIFRTFGVRLSFIIGFLLAACGGLLMVIFFNSDGALIAIFVLFAKSGIALALNLCYIAMP